MCSEIEKLEQRIKELEQVLLVLEHDMARLTLDLKNKEQVLLYNIEVAVRAFEIIKKKKYTKPQYKEAIKEAEIDILLDSFIKNTKYGFEQ